MTSHTHRIARNQQSGSTSLSAMIHCVLCLICCHLRSAGFWCWYFASLAQALMTRLLSISNTTFDLSSLALSVMRMLGAPRSRMTSCSVATNCEVDFIRYTSATRDFVPTNNWQYLHPLEPIAATAALTESDASPSFLLGMLVAG